MCFKSALTVYYIYWNSNDWELGHSHVVMESEWVNICIQVYSEKGWAKAEAQPIFNHELSTNLKKEKQDKNY